MLTIKKMFLTENTEFTVVGIIGPSGVGKSTIMNELYGFDGSLPGMLPPFTILSEDTRAMARHCTSGIEPRISAERLILLDTQPVLASSVLPEMMRPDGSSMVPVLGGESLSAELAHELMNIQVDLLKHGIPDPSSLSASHSDRGLITKVYFRRPKKSREEAGPKKEGGDDTKKFSTEDSKITNMEGNLGIKEASLE